MKRRKLKKPGEFVMFQWPNKWACIAIAGYIMTWMFDSWLGLLGESMYVVCAIVWAYLEIKEGANWFRRMLGILVILLVLYQLFNGLL